MRGTMDFARNRLKQSLVHVPQKFINRNYSSGTPTLQNLNTAQNRAVNWLAKSGKLATSCQTFLYRGYVIDVLGFTSVNPALNVYGDSIAILRNPNKTLNNYHVVNMIWKTTSKNGRNIPAKLKRMFEIYGTQLPHWGFGPNTAFQGTPIVFDTQEKSENTRHSMAFRWNNSGHPEWVVPSTEDAAEEHPAKSSIKSNSVRNSKIEPTPFFESNSTLSSKCTEMIPFWRYGQKFKVLQSQVWLNRHTESNKFVCTRHYKDYTVDVFDFVGRKNTKDISGDRIAIVRNLNDDKVGSMLEPRPAYHSWVKRKGLTKQQMDELLTTWLDLTKETLSRTGYTQSSKALRSKVFQFPPLSSETVLESPLTDPALVEKLRIGEPKPPVPSKQLQSEFWLRSQGYLNVRHTCKMNNKVDIFTYIELNANKLKICRMAIHRKSNEDKDYPAKAIKTSWDILSEGKVPVDQFLGAKVKSLFGGATTMPKSIDHKIK